MDKSIEELNIPAVSVGSMACKRVDIAKGIEPDTGYYIQNEALIRNRDLVDLNQDPPPDLVLEVEYSHSAVDKLNLYAAFGVPEVWRFDGMALYVYQLDGIHYIECETNSTFPNIPVQEIPRFLQEAKEMNELIMVKNFRNWVQHFGFITPDSFSETLDFACALRTQNQGFQKNCPECCGL